MFEDLFRPFDEFIPSLFPRHASSLFSEGQAFNQPVLDVQDRGDHFSVTAELPGLTKDEVEVRVDARGIELRAEKSQDESEKGAHRRSTRSYYQYLSLPDQVLTEGIDGTMKNGILELRLPKRAPELEDQTRRVDLK